MEQDNKQSHLFFYDGTGMTYPSMEKEQMNHMLENVFESMKKDMALNGLEPTKKNIKKYCEYFLEKMNAELLSTEGDNITFKKMRLAWGKEAQSNQIYWCAYVWILENKCGVISTNMFGYMSMEIPEEVYNEIAEIKSDFKCANCSHTYPSMMKCSACKNERYCSSECQKSHWKIHKKVCCK
jgi:hypothetical protein